nr:Na+/H+ antiporter NhaC family protein [Clostridium aminobutyricum]
MLIATAGNANIGIISGAIISGAYFGDRMSLMSSSAALVANVSKSSLMKNMRNMAKSGLIATILTVGFFCYMSKYTALDTIDSQIQTQLEKAFHVSYILLIPAALLLVMALAGIRMNVAMMISIVSALFLAIFKQDHAVAEVAKTLVFGYQMEEKTNPLYTIIQGGGILSMGKAGLVVLVSSALVGLLTELKVMHSIKNHIESKTYTRQGLFFMTSVVASLVGMIGCNQSIAIIMTADMMKGAYQQYHWRKDDDLKMDTEDFIHQQLAIDLENSAVLIAGLIPWSIASMVPASTIGVTPFVFIPFAFFLYAVPICYFTQLAVSEKYKKIKNNRFDSTA